MSRRRTLEREAKRHLAAVPPAGTPDKPTAVGFPVTIQLPTGGLWNLEGLLRELARYAFGPSLCGWRIEAVNGRPCAFVTCQPLSTFTTEQIQEGEKRLKAALFALGVAKPAQKAEPATEPPPAAQDPKTEAAPCPPPSSPES